MICLPSRKICLHTSSITLFSIALGAAPAGAEGRPVRVSAVVETEDGLFFQPAAFPDVVWYFPRSGIRLFPVVPSNPAANFWRATVDLVEVDLGDLGALRPDWRGKTAVPYIVRPATECVLATVPEMRFVQQEIRALGRDVSAAIDVPACQFVFRLPLVIPAELSARLEELRLSGALITRDLHVSLELRSTISWSIVHAAVAAAVGDGSADEGSDRPDLTVEQAREAIRAGLESDALEEVNDLMTDAERLAFVDQVLLRLFESDTSEDVLVLVDVPPAGKVLYHLELIERSM